MQERRFAPRHDVRAHRTHQPGRMSAAAEIRMGADAADFGVAARMQPFTGHRRQPSLFANTDKASHRVGAGQERARTG